MYGTRHSPLYSYQTDPPSSFLKYIIGGSGYEKVILAGDSAGGYLSLRALLEGSEGTAGAWARAHGRPRSPRWV